VVFMKDTSLYWTVLTREVLISNHFNRRTYDYIFRILRCCTNWPIWHQSPETHHWSVMNSKYHNFFTSSLTVLLICDIIIIWRFKICCNSYFLRRTLKITKNKSFCPLGFECQPCCSIFCPLFIFE